jgi:ADP-ribose pyrophosphatase
MVFKGRLLSFHVERHRLPNGHVTDLEIVRHPGAVLIVPILGEKVILIKQYRPVIDSYIWELPAGTLKKGEPPLKCAKREMAEEIGYEAANWKKIGRIYTTPGFSTERIYLYTARRLKKAPHKKEDDEIITQRAFKKREIKRLLDSGNITDAKTICALELAGIL